MMSTSPPLVKGKCGHQFLSNFRRLNPVGNKCDVQDYSFVVCGWTSFQIVVLQTKCKYSQFCKDVVELTELLEIFNEPWAESPDDL